MSQFLSTSELAERWKTSPGQLANLRSRGEGPAYIKISSRVLYALADIEQYEAARRVESVAA